MSDHNKESKEFIMTAYRCIQRHGLEAFTQYAAEFKDKYYKGKIAVDADRRWSDL